MRLRGLFTSNSDCGKGQDPQGMLTLQTQGWKEFQDGRVPCHRTMNPWAVRYIKKIIWFSHLHSDKERPSELPFLWEKLIQKRWLSWFYPRSEVASCHCLQLQRWQRRAQLIHRRAINVYSSGRNQLPSGQMARVIKLLLIFSKRCFRMKNGAVQLKALSEKHEMHTDGLLSRTGWHQALRKLHGLQTKLLQRFQSADGTPQTITFTR